MTQHRPLPGRQDRRHPSPSPTDPARTDDIDAAQILVQPSTLQTTVDRFPPHPPLEQLPPRNDPVLPLSKSRNHLVPRTNR